MFPTVRDNPDYGAVISQRHYDRLTGYLDDAREKGAEIVTLAPPGERFEQQEHRKVPPTLVLNATDDMAVMKEEIFGRGRRVSGSGGVRAAGGGIVGHDRPLGLYWFGTDDAERERVLGATTSGGVTVNDVVFHVAQEELPFGGVGPSGMGAYHGEDGFREFSHRRSIYTQVKKDLGPMQALRPPYGAASQKYLAGVLRR